MTSISSGIAINNSGVRLIDNAQLKPIHISELPKEDYQRIMKAQERMLVMRYKNLPNTADNKTYSEYAKVTVDGKTVAEIDNHGWVKTSNSLSGRISKNLPAEAGGVITGPALAQARAEYIAELMGGQVEKSSTALTQREFNSIPQPKVTIDYDAMKQDPFYQQLQKTRQARTAFLAQQIAQENRETRQVLDGQEESDSASARNAVREFLDYMDKTPEERLFEAILRELGLTKEELDALSPEEYAKVMDKIEEKMKEKLTLQQEKNAKKEQEKIS